MENLENNSRTEIDEDRLEFIYDRYKNNLERRIANINRAWRRRGKRFFAMPLYGVMSCMP